MGVSPATIGVVVEHVFEGELDGWEVKEFVSLDEDETSRGVFEIVDEYTSDWLPADPGSGQHRIDVHLISTSAINFNHLERDGTQYKCVHTQSFRKRPDGSSSNGELIEESGFIITTILTWQDGQWVYCSEKTGAQVLSAGAGDGTVRNPAAGWVRVPL